jgi:hypothetical protein
MYFGPSKSMAKGHPRHDKGLGRHLWGWYGKNKGYE